ncbi:conjugal transfer protein TrbF [uncultured Sneathiella sp.]|uniref:conjugal transfer protein TrbF n=1 Tax=uncultured Sneathiella sp. TaxID=879315 RepID=UPI0030DB1A61|tara:strand:+ start:17523 stop:18278 length:756 start_codon:yes stop_codon:yes gene_type:complete
MIFKRPGNRYGRTPEPITSYQKAGQVWDARMGSALVQARNWRWMAFGTLGLSLILSGGVIWQAGRSHIVPYVVELEARGAARAVRSAVETYQPTDAQIAFHLASFIEKVRSLPIDPIIVRQNWLQAYDYVTKHAANSLNEYAQKADPFSLVGEQTVAIDVTSIVRASDTSFQIRWVERRYINGSLATTERWTALATVQINPPRDANTLRKNPLGIYVTSLNWSRELEVVRPQQTPRRQIPSPSKSITGDPK